MNYFFASIACCFLLTASSEYILPKQNYQHWTRVDEICETRSPVNGKPVTYGVNEYVKSKSGTSFVICRWGQVPHTPYNEKK